MKRQRTWQQLLTVWIGLAVFFTLLFYADNKYQTQPPYGKSGVIEINEKNLKRNLPVFLIDGWLLTDGRTSQMPTYIGEFSSLQRGEALASPHGRVQYELTLRYDGTPQIVSVDFPQLSFFYWIFLDGGLLAQGSGNGRITFLLTPGDHILTVETSSKLGYYSGMYFPPSLGMVRTIQQMERVQCFVYALAFFLPLVLAVFTIFLWRTKDPLSRWFGMLCCCYAVYMLRYFVFLFSLPGAQYWFLAQNLAFYCLCFCVVKLMALVAGAACEKVWERIKVVLLMLPVSLLMLCLLIPVLPWVVLVHSRMTDIYYLFTFGCSVFFSMKGMTEQGWEGRYTLAGCSVFGAGLAINLFFSNLFEPIRFFWQFEWCGLLLVVLFGAMMVSRSQRILKENDRFANHLEEQIKIRTQEVIQLLDERKAFFSDLAHDLKAPVFATQSFIRAIRRSGVGVDSELQSYLDQAEAKQREMARRLQGLSVIHELDKIKEAKVRVSIRELLLEVYSTHHGEAEVQAVYFFVEPPQKEAFLTAQPEKLNILFENLIYNALKATPHNGSITVFSWIEGNRIFISVEDTGCGIPEEELPFIFQRFYVGANNRDTGTGLGLYVVHSIVSELGGTIYVKSTVGKGTKFVMEFPLEL